MCLYRRNRNLQFIFSWESVSLKNDPKLVITKDAKTYKLLDYYLRCNNISVISQHSNSNRGNWIPGENHWLVVIHWKILSHKVVWNMSPPMAGIQLITFSVDEHRLHG